MHCQRNIKSCIFVFEKYDLGLATQLVTHVYGRL